LHFFLKFSLEFSCAILLGPHLADLLSTDRRWRDGIETPRQAAQQKGGPRTVLDIDSLKSGTLLFAHDLFEKPLHTFSDHALAVEQADRTDSVVDPTRPEIGGNHPPNSDGRAVADKRLLTTSRSIIEAGALWVREPRESRSVPT
jgi:hypothetical protein